MYDYIPSAVALLTNLKPFFPLHWTFCNSFCLLVYTYEVLFYCLSVWLLGWGFENMSYLFEFEPLLFLMIHFHILGQQFFLLILFMENIVAQFTFKVFYRK